MTSTPTVRRVLVLLALLAPWLLVVREVRREQTITERTNLPVTPRPADQSAWVNGICDRWAHLSETLSAASAERATKTEVKRLAGLPSTRTKEYRGLVQWSHRPSWDYTAAGPDEAWVYELGGGVMIAIKFDAEERACAFETTGIKFFLQSLPRDVEAKPGGIPDRRRQ